jgi:hypothetical protein
LPELLFTGPSEAGWHDRELALRCLRLYALRKSNKVEFTVDAKTRGSLIHVGFAHHYARLKLQQCGKSPDVYYSPADAQDVAAAKMIAEAAERDRPNIALSLRDMLPRCRAAIEAYAALNAGEREEILAVERQYETKLFYPKGLTVDGRPWTKYTARFDLVKRDANGRVWVIDHKSTSASIGRVDRRYTLSGQILGLRLLGAEAFGGNFEAVVLNVVRVAEGASPAFKQILPERAPEAESNFAYTIWMADNRIHQMKGKTVWEHPMTTTELTCMTDYGPCGGFDWCVWGLAKPE